MHRTSISVGPKRSDGGTVAGGLLADKSACVLNTLPAAHTPSIACRPRACVVEIVVVAKYAPPDAIYGVSRAPDASPFGSDSGAAQPQASPVLRGESHRFLRSVFRKGESPRRVKTICCQLFLRYALRSTSNCMCLRAADYLCALPHATIQPHAVVLVDFVFVRTRWTRR